MLQLLRPLCRFVGDFESSKDICTSSTGDLVPYSHTSGSYSSITTRYFINHIGLLKSEDLLHHNMACIIYVSLYIYIQRYRDNGDGLSDRQYIFGIPQGR